MKIIYKIIIALIICISLPIKTNAETTDININSEQEFEFRNDGQNKHKIVLKEGENITIVVQAKLTNGSLDINLTSSEFEYQSQKYSVSGDNILMTDIYVPFSGEYTINISGNTIGKYSLAVYGGWSNLDEKDENRPFNSTIETAKYLRDGSYSISEYGKDYYRFIANEGEIVNINALVNKSEGDINFRIIAPDGWEIAELKKENGRYNISQGELAKISYKVPYTGVYYLSIKGDGEVNISCEGIQELKDSDSDKVFDDVEIRLGSDINNKDTNNNGISDYEEIKKGDSPVYLNNIEPKLGETIQYKFNNESDHDYSFTFVKGQKIQIYMKAINNSSILSILAKPTKDRDYERELMKHSLGAESEIFTTFEVPETAEYIIRVSSSYNKYGTYLLGIEDSWQNVNSNVDSIRNNATLETANYLKNGKYKRHNEDYFYFVLKENSEITLNITSSMALYNDQHSFTILDRNGNKVRDIQIEDKSWARNSKDETLTIKYTAPITDLYYLKVTGSDGYIDINVEGIEENNDGNNDGLTDAQKLCYGLSLTETDTDGDGFSDYDELLYGTDAKEATADEIFNEKKKLYDEFNKDNKENEQTKIEETKKNDKKAIPKTVKISLGVLGGIIIVVVILRVIADIKGTV